MNKKKVLFICTHNSARSQIAEGLLKNLYGDRFDAFSAGTKPSSVNPYAIEAMKEIGIDISNHRSKSMDEFRGTKIDYVITVCDNAKESCPFFPDGARYLHKSFNDPSQFKGTEEEILSAFRQIRNDIKEWIEKTFGQEINQLDIMMDPLNINNI
jgi:arsenate reductase (thioredoxin)